MLELSNYFSQNDLDIFEEFKNRQAAEDSLYEFVRQGWHAIEGDTPFVPGWHLKIICEHLEAAYYGKIKKLIISVPPRTGKTSVISIMWPAWVWIRKPDTKFLFSSYAIKISWDHSRLCRMLIESPWYQNRWGHIVKLSKDQSTKGYFANESLGYRIATSVGAGGTALGGDVLVMDDPNETSESQVTREGTNDWVSRVWASRLNPGGLGVNVLVQQRTDEMDVSGFLMSRDRKNEIVKLILPMEFEESRRAKTIILPSSKGKIWQDPRKKDGDLLCPDYLTDADIANKKIELGAYNYASQYQQRPAPEEGGIIKKYWFKWWKEAKPPRIIRTIQSWDTALEANEMDAYSACTTWGYFMDENKVPCIILLSLWRGRIEYPDLRKLAKNLADDYRNDGTVDITPDGHHTVDMILVEAKASGISLIQDLRRTGINVSKFDPTPYGDKLQRVRIASSYIADGHIFIPALPPSYLTLRPMSEKLVELCSIFPNSESRDVVDTLTQLILRLSSDGFLVHRRDPKWEAPSAPNHAFYGPY